MVSLLVVGVELDGAMIEVCAVHKPYSRKVI
jgi:hypothetical protein